MKTPDDYFHDWESSVFGYGYGSGEEHVIPALWKFMGRICADGCYKYDELERAVSPTVAWLLINALCHADLIEYGSSPRFGWLTDTGKALKAYMDSKTVEELLAALNRDHEYSECYRDHCNCEREDCRNPFWVDANPRGNNR